MAGIKSGGSYRVHNSQSVVTVPTSRMGPLIAGGALAVLLLASAATAQVGYTFTSGPTGDGFNWPASPTGLLDGDSFTTPDGVEFQNYIGNNLFFDSQYQVVGNTPGITDEAMWGNPDFESDVDIYLDGVDAQTVEFDFAWSVGGSPGATPDETYIYLEDSEGRATEVFITLGVTFTGFGGFDGYADHLTFDAADFVDDFFSNDGGPFVDIGYIVIYMDSIATGGPPSEFGMDNFSVDGGLSGADDLFPSINGGTIDVTGSILSSSVLRGVGTHFRNFEVTNQGASATTYSTQLLPGGGFADNGQASGIPISAGVTQATPNILSLDRSLPSETYDSDVTLVNDGNTGDPDNTLTLRARLFEAPLLTAPSPVDVTAAEKARLINAAAPANGWRATAEVTGTSTTGPFAVAGYGVDTPAKPGEFIEGDATFDRYGRLTGGYNGTFTASLQMTAYLGVNNDIEVFLANAEPLPDEQWTLNATLGDTPSDNVAYAPSDPLGPGVVGTNSASTAATIVGGTATGTGNVSMTQGSGQAGTSTGIIAQAADVDFSTTVPVHVVQMTYRDADICPDVTEANLRLLYYNTGATDWELAVDGNSDGGSGASFFVGSFSDFAATLGGSPLSSALSTHGLDATNNHVWAILDHEAQFGLGEIGQSCYVDPDFDQDGDVDGGDQDTFELCASGPDVPHTGTATCQTADFDDDNDVDQDDFAVVQGCISGAGNPPDQTCDD